MPSKSLLSTTKSLIFLTGLIFYPTAKLDPAYMAAKSR